MDNIEFLKVEQLINQQVSEIESLKVKPAYNAKYSIWENTTLKILKKYFDNTYVEMFQNSGPSIMAMNEEHHYRNYLIDLKEKETLLQGFLEESKKLREFPETDFSVGENFSIYDLHQDIKRVSLKLFEDKHYPQAVEEAFKRVILEVKCLYKKETGVEIDGDNLINKSMGCENQEPVIKFNYLKSSEDKDEQKGIMFLFKGVVAIRNKKAHNNVILKNKGKAFEYLALASLLLRLLETRY